MEGISYIMYLSPNIRLKLYLAQTSDIHLTFILLISSRGSKCKLDLQRLAASMSSNSTRTLSSFKIFTVVTFPYRQNKLNTRSQLTGTRSKPCTSRILLGWDRLQGSTRWRGCGGESESPLSGPVTTRVDHSSFLYCTNDRHYC